MDDFVRSAAREFAAEAGPEVVGLCRKSLDRVLGEGMCAERGQGEGLSITRENLAGMIDHTNLRPTAARADIEHLVEEALSCGFAAVCVNPAWVPLTRRLLDDADTRVRLCTVVGFPLGANSSRIKKEEARIAIGEGADEIDMVINLGALKGRDYEGFVADASSVVDVCRGVATKAIIEVCYLEDSEKVITCLVLESLGYDFVKTSTGFGKHGATAEDVTLLRASVGPGMGVKAAGGIRSLGDAIAMVRAGASRIGTSSGVEIVSRAE